MWITDKITGVSYQSISQGRYVFPSIMRAVLNHPKLKRIVEKRKGDTTHYIHNHKSNLRGRTTKLILKTSQQHQIIEITYD